MNSYENKLNEILKNSNSKDAVAKFINTKEGQKIIKQMGNIDKEKLMRTFMNMDTEQLKKKLGNVDLSKLSGINADEIINKLK